MALTDDMKRRAARLFVQKTYKDTKKAIPFTGPQIIAEITSVDDWWDAAPTGGGTNLSKVNGELSAGAQAGLTDAEKALLVSAVLLARGGSPLLPG